MEKKLLRKEMLKKQASLSKNYRETSESIIFNKLIQLKEYQEARMIFCYVGTTYEMNTSKMIDYFLKDGKRVCVPKVVKLGEMKALEIRALSDLEEGHYHIMEPKETCPEIAKNMIDFAVVPCVTADKQGYRLGYGGGFYDRFMANTSMYKVLCIWEKMIVEQVPREEHDQRVDLVLTED